MERAAVVIAAHDEDASSVAAPADYGIVTEAMILRTYGPRLTLEELALLLKMSLETIRKQLRSDSFPIPTYLENNRRYADYRAVARHIDRRALEAEEAALALQRARARAERQAARPRRRRVVPPPPCAT
jgi:hypothetical protein